MGNDKDKQENPAVDRDMLQAGNPRRADGAPLEGLQHGVVGDQLPLLTRTRRRIRIGSEPLDQLVLHGIEGRLGSIIDGQFAQDAGHMVLDRLPADAQFIGYLFITLALGDVLQDFHFAGRQGREHLVWHAIDIGHLIELLQQPIGHFRLVEHFIIDHIIPFAYLADRFDRRRLMVGVDLGRAVLALGLLFVRDADALIQTVAITEDDEWVVVAGNLPCYSAGFPASTREWIDNYVAGGKEIDVSRQPVPGSSLTVRRQVDADNRFGYLEGRNRYSNSYPWSPEVWLARRRRYGL